MSARPNREQIRLAVTRGVTKLMERSGRAGRVPSSGDTLSNLGLASEDGVELACILEATLKIRIPHDANPLIEESGGQRRPRNIQQVCDAVAVWAAAGGLK